MSCLEPIEKRFLWGRLNNPPRPLASRRVEALTQQPTFQTSKISKTSPQGGGFPLPLPPPRPLGPDRCSRLWCARPPLDHLKSSVKMSISCLWADLDPIKVVMLTTSAQKKIILTIILRKSRQVTPKVSPKSPSYVKSDPTSDVKLTSSFHKIIKISWENECFLKCTLLYPK